MSVLSPLTTETTLSDFRREAAAHNVLLEDPSPRRTDAVPHAGEGRRKAPRGLLRWQVRKLREYVDSHLPSPILVADLCVLVGLSEAYFTRCFKNSFGISPYAFVLRRRLELAARYMLQTDAPLSDVALRCGFADQAHLGNRFRDAIGVPPAAWRRFHCASGMYKPDETA